jgi:putative acyl-CoA dehydrogenase
MKTHDVLNQSTALANYNMFTSDRLLVQLVSDYGAAWAAPRLTTFGGIVGSAEAIEWAVQANRNDPELRTHSRFGERVDEVQFHPAWHNLMRTSVEHEVHSLPWRNPQPGAHVARAALMYMAFQNEAGHCCPISMTYSAVPALRKTPGLADIWEPLILQNQYDPRNLPASLKNGVLIGMGMTEKQGGSDVRANTSRAKPLGQPGSGNLYLLTGHKWFCSAPMSDAFLILAQTEKGVSCFLVPRWKPDGTKNNVQIQRLKDKLGNRSNASSEIEFQDAYGYLVGEEGRGVATIIEMVNHTRLDCMLAATSLMRQATLQAIHHCKQRSAFGKKLVDQPLMTNVLADLVLESEAALRLAMRVAAAYDAQQESPQEAAFRRIASAISKYWLCKRVPMHVAEALECFGGNGYVEESPMPRMFRESPLNGIWEGSGNVICLDVLRAIAKEPQALDSLVAELDKGLGKSTHVDRYLKSLKTKLNALKRNVAKRGAAALTESEAEARMLVERMALALQASLMVRGSTPANAELFIASRIRRQSGLALGTLPKGNLKAVVDGAYLA